jgi:hypothetical protein
MNAKTITSTDMWSPDLVGRTDLVLGSRVRCCDGPAGTLTRIVLDPVSGAVTHLVVLGRAGQRTLRLVPIHLVESAGDDIWLHCDRSAFEALEVAEGREYVPASDDGRRMDADWGLHEPFYWLTGPAGPLADPRREHPGRRRGHRPWRAGARHGWGRRARHRDRARP